MGYPGGPPQEIAVGGGGAPPQEEGGGDIEGRVDSFLNALSEFAARDGLDAQEKLKIEKVRTLIMEIVANRQKESEAALGVSPAVKMVERARRSG